MNNNPLSPDTPFEPEISRPEEELHTDALSEYPDFPFDEVLAQEPITPASVDNRPTLSPLFPEGTILPEEPQADAPAPEAEPAPQQAPAPQPEPAPRPAPQWPYYTQPQAPGYPHPGAPYGQQPPYRQQPPYGQPAHHGGQAPYAPPGQAPLPRTPGSGPIPNNAPVSAPNNISNRAPGAPNGNNFNPGTNRYPYGNPGYPHGPNGYGNVPPSQFPPAGNFYPPVQPKKKKPGTWLLILLIAGCILIGSVFGLVIAKSAGSTSNPSESAPAVSSASIPTEAQKPTEEPQVTTPRETQPLATSGGELMTLNEIYSSTVPAIVGITNEATGTSFGQATTSAGSGFIISSDGEILTNYHVVEGANKITVSLYDGRTFPATLIGYEAESDVALIKIDAENLPVCAIGNSDTVYVGEQIAAIGNPMGELSYTMTVGYVSALNRFVNTDGTPINMIQVDAAINPGNSGGPVFNLYGEVIGIATAKYSGTLSGGATLEGLGFAIPINDIVDILNDLRISGKVPDRAYMGIVVHEITLDKETHGIDHGVYVNSVDASGSAAKAGMQDGDIILKIDDVETNAYANLQQALRKYRAGDKATVTVFRNGKTLTLNIEFDAKPDSTSIPEEQYTVPEETENPWGTFPWEDFPWG